MPLAADAWPYAGDEMKSNSSSVISFEMNSSSKSEFFFAQNSSINSPSSPLSFASSSSSRRRRCERFGTEPHFSYLVANRVVNCTMRFIQTCCDFRHFGPSSVSRQRLFSAQPLRCLPYELNTRIKPKNTQRGKNNNLPSSCLTC